MTTISREGLQAPLAVKSERVDLPEFGDDAYVMVYGLTARELNKHNVSLLKKDCTGVDKVKATEEKERLVIAATRDDSGQRIFCDGDIVTIGKWPADVLMRIYKVAENLNGGENTDEKAEKNSPETTDD